MNKLKVEIVTPIGVIFSGDVSSVTVPGAEGEFGVLPGHSSLVSLLTAGVIEIYKLDGTVDDVAVDSGYVEVSSNSVVILAEGAVAMIGKDGSEIAKAITDAKALIDAAHSKDMFMAKLEAKIEMVGKAYTN